MRHIGLAAGAIAFFGAAALMEADSAHGAAQAITVTLGDGTIDASRLAPYDNAFAVTYEAANGEKISTGIWTDQLRMRDVNGRKAWVRTQSMASFNGLVLTSINTFDPATLAPISTILKGRDGSREYWTFTGKTAEGHIVSPEGHETVKTIALTKPAYDFNCCMASLIPAALPLSAGKTFALPGIPSKDGDPDAYPFRVRGRERIHAGYLGMVDTWVVDFHQPGSGTVTFWMTDNPRHAVRERLVDFPSSKTCAAPETAQAALCPAQGSTAGVHYDQTFDMLGGPPMRH